jgi:hypothetical protein
VKVLRTGAPRDYHAQVGLCAPKAFTAWRPFRQLAASVETHLSCPPQRDSNRTVSLKCRRPIAVDRKCKIIILIQQLTDDCGIARDTCCGAGIIPTRWSTGLIGNCNPWTFCRRIKPITTAIPSSQGGWIRGFYMAALPVISVRVSQTSFGRMCPLSHLSSSHSLRAWSPQAGLACVNIGPCWLDTRAFGRPQSGLEKV